jgi:hypothetical protein
VGKTALILNGLTLDKAMFNSILKQVANDGHIRYAIDEVRGSVSQREWADVAEDICNMLGGIIKGAEVMEAAVGPANMLRLLVIGGAVDVAQLIISRIRRRWPQYTSQIDLSRRNNFDYWRIFFSNLSDTQTLIASTKTFTRRNAKAYDGISKTKQVFCGRPYYQNMYIDSLVIGIKKKDNTDKQIRALVKELVEEHIKSVFYAEYICKGIESDTQLGSGIKNRARVILGDRILFGIYFLSGLIKGLYGDEEVTFEYSTDLITDSGSLKEDGVFVRELVLLAGNPGKVKFCSQGKGNGDNIIKLIRIDRGISQDNSKKKFDQLFYENAQDDGYVRVVVPIKRIVSMPVSYAEKLESLTEIPEPYEEDIYPLPDVFQNDDLRIFAVGGAEHNLPLVHLVNIMRYKDRENRSFGFVENAFDRQMRDQPRALPEFMMALERFVSGLNVLARARATSEASAAYTEQQIYSNEAEVLRIEFDKRIEGYAIYGYSAPMTLYAFLGLLYALDKRNDCLFIEDKSRDKYKQTEYCNFDRTKIAVYYIGKDESDFNENLVNDFNKMDIMNNFEKDKVKRLIIENLSLRTRG